MNMSFDHSVRQGQPNSLSFPLTSRRLIHSFDMSPIDSSVTVVTPLPATPSAL